MILENISNLKGILTYAEPLGPIDQILIPGDIAECLIDSQVYPFTQLEGKSYMLLLGRKGAGKSAILDEIQLKLKQGCRLLPPPTENLPREREPFIIPLMSWERFHQITRNVATQFHINELLADLVPPEHYSLLWYEMLWDEIIQHFFNYTHLKGARRDLVPVKKYINADSYFQGSAEKEAKKLFDAARYSIVTFLEKRKSHLYFLFDSMENYPVRNTIFTRVLKGLFQALNKINCESEYIQISFCIPEEVEIFLNSNSSTLLKDFASSYRIRWRPIDLLRITAHRFRLAMAIHDKEFFREISELDFSKREHIHQLFSQVLPPNIKNSLGVIEDPLAYIIRHTQLLPRHVIAIFNAILSRNYHSTGSFRNVTELSIREGISHIQPFIAQQILYPYNHIYPELITTCKEILPQLNPICSFSDLSKVERRFPKAIEEEDVYSVWDTLFHIGMIGRVVKPTSNEIIQVGSSDGDRYCYGQFHFNIDGSFGMSTDNDYCFHPIFSMTFGLVRQKDDKRVVYPANVDMITITRYE
jgi:hypothetical protein